MSATGLFKPLQWFMNYISGNEEDTRNIAPENAVKSAAFLYGVRKISNNFGMLPCSLYRKKGDSTLVQDSHASHIVLKSAPNAYQVPSIWKQQHMNHALLWGNGRSYISREKGTLELIPLMPDRTITCMVKGEKIHACKPDRDDRFDLMTDMRQNPEETVVIKDIDVIHTMGFTLDGIEGISLVRMAAITIMSDIAADKHSLSQVKKAYSGGLVLEAPPGEFREEAKAKEFLEQWRETHDGENNAGKTSLLRNGVKATVLSMSNADAQMFEGRKFTRQQIALWLGLESILGDDNSVSYKSLEQKVLAYLMNCLGAWLTQFEEQANAKLLNDREKRGGYYFRFNDGALLRSDKTATAEFVSKLIAATIINRNEGRAMFDLNPVEGGEVFANPATTSGNKEESPAPVKPSSNATQTSKSVDDILEKVFSEYVTVEAKRVQDLTKTGPFVAKVEKFYAQWEPKLADKLEEFGLERDKARIHCAESSEQLVQIAEKNTEKTLQKAVETCTNTWAIRSKQLIIG